MYNLENIQDTYCKIVLLFVLLGLKEPDSESGGQWVHVSDTYVQVVPESRALSAQAYLLFYERIL
jgi:hypothetical protein